MSHSSIIFRVVQLPLALLLAALITGCEEDPTMIPLESDNETEQEESSSTPTPAPAPDTPDTSADSDDTGVGYIDLTSAYARISGNINIMYNGAAYDTYYSNSPHWRITTMNGYMYFSFKGRHTFTFHALGSTSQGVSYCYVDVSVNGNLYWDDMFINSSWNYYTIPASAFGSGKNSVNITLVGQTHIWIDEVYTE